MSHYHAMIAMESKDPLDATSYQMNAHDSGKIGEFLEDRLAEMSKWWDWEAELDKYTRLAEFLRDGDFPASWTAKIGPVTMFVFAFMADWCEYQNGAHIMTCWGTPLEPKRWPGIAAFE